MKTHLKVKPIYLLFVFFFFNLQITSAQYFEEVTTDGWSMGDKTITKPVFIDIDGDNLMDMFIGDLTNGKIRRYEQAGPNSSDFKIVTYSFLDITSNAIPCFTDIDGDGLIDLLVVVEKTVWHWPYHQTINTIYRYEQNYSGSEIFEYITEISGLPSTGDVLDLDGDGLLDMLIGNAYYEQTAPKANSFDLITSDLNVSGLIVDIDNDGLLDMYKVYGNDDNRYFSHYKQIKQNSLNFELIADSVGNFNVSYNAQFSITDLNSDGLKDLFVFNDGTIQQYKQTVPGQFLFNLIKENILNSTYFGWFLKPTITDLDKNGLLDLIITSEAWDGAKCFEQETYNSENFVFKGKILDDDWIFSKNQLYFHDIDNDNLLDLLFIDDNNDRNLYHYEQTTSDPYQFTKITEKFLVNQSNYEFNGMALTDLNNNGLVDLVLRVGDHLQLYEQENKYQYKFKLIKENILDKKWDSKTFRKTTSAFTFLKLKSDGLFDLLMFNTVYENRYKPILMHFQQEKENSISFVFTDRVYLNIPVDDYDTYPLTSTDVDGDGNDDIILADERKSLFLFRRIVESEPPLIQDIIVGSNWYNNWPNLIKVKATDNKEIRFVKLFFRRGGNTNFVEMNMEYEDDFYEAELPDSIFDNGNYSYWNEYRSGVEYYISVDDKAGNETDSPHYMMKVDYGSGSYQINYSSGASQDNYQMVSFPFVFTDPRVKQVFFDSNYEYNKENFRIFRFENGEYKEYPNCSNVEPGNAFWTLGKSRKYFQNNRDGMSSVPAKDYYPITLEPGWNQIGLPFNFNISWQDILDITNEEGLFGPYLYENGSYRNPLPEALEPFKGYFIENRQPTPVTLKIPFNSARASLNKVKQNNFDWQLNIRAQAENVKDINNILGVSNSSNDEYDCNDLSEPPPVGDYISLYFANSKWEKYPGKYMQDIRSPEKEGHFWDIEFKTNMPNEIIELSIDELLDSKQNFVPENYKILLIDPTLNLVHDFRKKPIYTFNSGNNTIKNFMLFVGKASFFEAQNSIISEIPKQFALFQNYPNPFNSQTTIRFNLPRQTNVTLVVYNMLGKKIKTLLSNKKIEAGYHLLQWDGTNDFKEKTASGVYLYLFRTDEYVKSKKMILVQ